MRVIVFRTSARWRVQFAEIEDADTACSTIWRAIFLGHCYLGTNSSLFLQLFTHYPVIWNMSDWIVSRQSIRSSVDTPSSSKRLSVLIIISSEVSIRG